ncbi:MAG: serine/threonine-protein kinase [Thermoleophilia bacterium]
MASRATVSSAPPGLAPGTRIGPYAVREHLGGGGVGEVYRAEPVDGGAAVALKVVRPELAANAEVARRVAHEVRAAGSLSHPNLVGLVAHGEDAGVTYMALELIDGGTLEGRIARGGALPAADAVERVTEVAEALDALHGRGIVHRDVKTGNVLLRGDGSAVLGDLGLAKGDGYTALTRAGRMVGTIAYAAPEVILTAEAGPAADLYALGCVAYECVAGRHPFAGRGFLELANAHLEEDPGDPCAGRDDAPSSLGEAIRAALAKDPAARPPGARAYARGLRAALEAA